MMEEFFNTASENFNISGKTVDSWYSSFHFLGNNFTTELKSNRKASLEHIGKMTIKNRNKFYKLDKLYMGTIPEQR